MRHGVVVSACVVVAMACSGPATNGTNGEVVGGTPAALHGAGSTFAAPLYSAWAQAYAKLTGVAITYAATGSGDGIRRFSEETVDFGGTDGPMSDSELAAAKGGAVLHIPVALGADVVMYNLPDVAAPVRFSPEVLADIFLGKITKWNDARLAALNSNITLPDEDILVVRRSDASGTTYVWTDYLSRVSAEWAKGPGRGKEVAWPVGMSAPGNNGVAGRIKATPGAVGYVELAYAKKLGMATGLVRNAAGQYVAATVESISAAAAGAAATLPSNTDFRISIVDPPGANAYPIASFTWMLVYQNQPDPMKEKTLVDFLRWALGDGQALESAINYAPLPASMLGSLRARLDDIHVSGRA